MFKQRRHVISFSAIAVAAFGAYLWIASDTPGPQTVQAEDVPVTTVMGAPAEITPVAEPGMAQRFEQEKKAARSQELPPQF